MGKPPHQMKTYAERVAESKEKDVSLIDLHKTGKTAEAEDPIFRPSHYTKYKAMEPITFLMLNDIPYAEGNVIKYVLRWRSKNGIEDLRKAIRYLEMMIELEENRDKYLPEIRCL